MPVPHERTSKKKFYRSPGGAARVTYIRGKSGRHHCAYCGGVLHGVPHSKGVAGTRALSRSQRRPSALFAGKLCTRCRATAVEEAAKVKSGFKAAEAVELSLKPFVLEAMARVE
ncbi:MAG TPA: 50S ribosomal protein L34e [Candidatus Diapherotrites archaeon]|uniref:50S ribosomal protein L34e n=1 Tax=Candidatus Iainarchaeum sp. TaxID=3101447 RepID=A0A7J4JFH3_9ARCH|nr:50S ribosomal protein L34e [Candidatus Diapherotrites archaeon]